MIKLVKNQVFKALLVLAHFSLPLSSLAQPASSSEVNDLIKDMDKTTQCANLYVEASKYENMGYKQHAYRLWQIYNANCNR
jgi:hypothetical protein